MNPRVSDPKAHALATVSCCFAVFSAPGTNHSLELDCRVRCYKKKQKTELAHYFGMLALSSQLWDLSKMLYNSIFLSIKNVLVVEGCEV